MSPCPPRCYGIIPARYASSRFPGKPLALLRGQPMFWHVFQRASACAALSRVLVATDDDRILHAARERGVPAMMTGAHHLSGTDRVYEAALAIGVEDQAVVVNIQGDEPALQPGMLDELLAPFCDPAVQVTTLAHAIVGEGSDSPAFCPDRVKVVLDLAGNALYFSRAPIPHAHPGQANTAEYLLHVGLYAYRFAALQRFTALPPGPLEQRERLEQLRLLENGIPVRVVRTAFRSQGVDRPEDIALLEQILSEN